MTRRIVVAEYGSPYRDDTDFAIYIDGKLKTVGGYLRNIIEMFVKEPFPIDTVIEYMHVDYEWIEDREFDWPNNETELVVSDD